MMKKAENYIFASILSGVYDVNRNQLLIEDDFESIRKWYDSIIALGLKAIIFHNTFSDETIARYQHDHVQFIYVKYDSKLNPNVQRYTIYSDYINQHYDSINNLFVTDISDVEVILNPFIQPLFLLNESNSIFCGDEMEILENDWMKKHGENLRMRIEDYADYELKNKNATLLNCGIIGGNKILMKMLLEQLSLIHQTHTIHNTTAYTGDMGAFNYVIRTQFEGCVLHGFPINTEFKKYQLDRKDCWFRHK